MTRRKPVAGTIDAFLEATGWTLERLAAASKRSVTTICRLRRGHRLPRPSTAKALKTASGGRIRVFGLTDETEATQE